MIDLFLLLLLISTTLICIIMSLIDRNDADYINELNNIFNSEKNK